MRRVLSHSQAYDKENDMRNEIVDSMTFVTSRTANVTWAVKYDGTVLAMWRNGAWTDAQHLAAQWTYDVIR